MRASHSFSSIAREHVFFAMLGIPRLLRHPVWRTADPGQGAGLGVLLVPGFGAADASLGLTSTWLRDRGYRPMSAHIGLNLGCTTELVDRIGQRLEQHADATGGRVVLLGQSRGGSLARLAAVRRPDLVRGLVTLGSPLRDPMDVHPHVLLAVKALARLSAAGVPGLMDDDCLSGTCYQDNMTAASTPLPPDVPAVSVYSKADGIVPWRLSLDPRADCVEVRSTHTGMGFDPDVYTALESRLASWTNQRKPALRAG
jgi:pimeloyl-ACP methyl ester carboxylesterase